jgi:hypothetical protein
VYKTIKTNNNKNNNNIHNNNINDIKDQLKITAHIKHQNNNQLTSNTATVSIYNSI